LPFRVGKIANVQREGLLKHPDLLTGIGFDFNIENDKRGSSGEMKPSSAWEHLGKG